MFPDRWLGNRLAPHGRQAALAVALLAATGTGGVEAADSAALERDCAAGVARACYDLGVEAYPKDLLRAADLYQRACAGGVSYGCSNLGLMQEKGEGVAKDEAAAAHSYMRGCELGLPKACVNAAYMQQNGLGVPQNSQAAVELYRKACVSNYALGCWNLVFHYQGGAGVVVDKGRALRLVARSCRLGFAEACSELDRWAAAGSPLPEPPRQPMDDVELLDQTDLQCKEALTRADVFVQVADLRRAREVLEGRWQRLGKTPAGPPRTISAVQLLVKLSNLAEQMKDFAVARDRLKEALILEEELLGPEEELPGPKRADLGRGYNDLGMLCASTGDRTCAQAAFRKSLASAQGAGDQVLVAAATNNLGSELMFAGEFQKAADAFAQALALRRKLLPPEDPMIAQNLGNLAFAHAALKQWRQAVGYQREHLGLLLKSMGRRMALGETMLESAYDTDITREWLGTVSWSITLDLMTQGQGGSREMAAMAVTSLPGLRTETLHAAIRDLRGRPDGQKLLAVLAEAQRRSSGAYLTPARGDDPGTPLAEANARLEEAERAVVRAAKPHPSGLVAPEKLLASLAPREALIAYAYYGRMDLQSRQTGEPRLAAYAFRPGAPIGFADLGPAALIVELIAKQNSIFNEGSPGSRKETDAILRDLHRRLLLPLEPMLAGCNRLIVVPGEIVATVPLEALIDSAGKYVLESRTLRYITNASELASTNRTTTPTARADLSRSTVVASPEFGAGQGRTLSSKRQLVFSPLPGSAAEGAAVATRLGVGQANLLVGARATEGAVRKLKSPPVLHIATHGYLIAEGDTPAAMGEIVQKASQASRTSTANVQSLDASEPVGVRAGVALSGANRPTARSGRDDGLLTALEMAGLDLRDTELVVLSSCESGLGAPAIGEGLEGLRSSLRVADARTRVLSLWKVSDCATAMMMDLWYERMLEGQDRIESLRQVKLQMLRGQVQAKASCTARGVTLSTAEQQNLAWSHPFFWAAFVSDGAAGPLIH